MKLGEDVFPRIDRFGNFDPCDLELEALELEAEREEAEQVAAVFAEAFPANDNDDEEVW